MSDGQLWTALVAVIAPLAVALFKRWKLSKEATSALILAAMIVVAGFGLLASGELDPRACAGIDLVECVKVVFSYVTLVLGVAFVYYKMVWQALGFDDKIAGK